MLGLCARGRPPCAMSMTIEHRYTMKGRGEHRNNIPFGKQLTVLHTTKLANVEWSRYSGGNSDDSPPHGTQVVGPIHRPQTGECPAAEVYFFAKDCPSSALQHRRQVQQ